MIVPSPRPATRSRTVVDDGPPAPVAGREGVEVRAERDATPGRDTRAASRGDVAGTLCLRSIANRGLGLARGGARDRGEPLVLALGVGGLEVGAALHIRLDVERDDVEVALKGQHDALQHSHVRRCLDCRCGRTGHSSTPPLISAAPSVKCGRNWLSIHVQSATRSPCACRGTGRCRAGRRTARRSRALAISRYVSSRSRSSAVLIG